MATKKHIEQEVGKTLKALDNLERAATDDFFYSRLTARMEHREQEGILEQKEGYDLGFTFSIAAVFMLMVLNLTFISLYPQADTDSATLNKDTIMQELVTEYTILDLNYYEYYGEE